MNIYEDKTTALPINLRKFSVMLVVFLVPTLFIAANAITKIALLAKYNHAVLTRGIKANDIMILMGVFVVFLLAVVCCILAWQHQSNHKAKNAFAEVFSISAATLIAATAVIYSISLARQHAPSPGFIKRANIALLAISCLVLLTSIAHVCNSSTQRHGAEKAIFTASLCTAVAGVVACAIALKDPAKGMVALEAVLLTLVVSFTLSTVFLLRRRLR